MSTPDLHAQLRHGAAGSPIVCIVRVGDGHGDGVAYDFRIVELCSTGITMSPEDLFHGVAQPGPSASYAASEIPRILMKKRGENALGHVVPNHEIAVRGAEVPRVPRSPLPK